MTPIARVGLAACAAPRSTGTFRAQKEVGRCFYFGIGVERDFAEAVKWLLRAAEGNNASAERLLAWCYLSGEGVRSDLPEFLRWYERATGHGDLEAQARLGDLLVEGKGVLTTSTEAWHSCATLQGEETLSRSSTWAASCSEVRL